MGSIPAAGPASAEVRLETRLQVLTKRISLHVSLSRGSSGDGIQSPDKVCFPIVHGRRQAHRGGRTAPLPETAPQAERYCFLFILTFYWSIVDLQCCVSFRCTGK